MIHEVFVLLRAALKAKGVPYDLVYGPPPVPYAVGGTRVHIYRPPQADAVAGPRSQHRNARQYSTRAMGATIQIFAHSTISGAGRHDHERIADKIVDQLQVELHKIVGAAKTVWRVLGSGFTTDFGTSDGWAGVVYELRIQIDRGVRDVSWVGDAAAEFTTDDFATDSTATGPGVSSDLPTATTRIES